MDDAFRVENGLKIFQTIPVFTFCFCGHMSIFSIVGELKDVTMKRLTIVILAATGSATLIFGTVAASTVTCFGVLTPQDLLSKYEQTPAVVVARIGMAIVCCGFFPLLVQPIRTTCLGWFQSAMTVGFHRQHSEDSKTTPLICPDTSRELVQRGYDRAVRHMLAFAYQAVTLAVVGASLCMALETSSLGVAFSLSGATGFALLCNVCPPWLYLVVSPSEEGRRWSRFVAWALLLYGILMMPVCVTANFMAAFPHPEQSVPPGPRQDGFPQCEVFPASCNVTAFCSSIMSS